MFARLSIVTAARQSTLLVPREAVLTRTGAEPLVVAIDNNNHVRKVPVRLGLQSERLTEVTSGLTEGQLVATSSLNDLSDGDIVAPQVENRVALAR
jgi:multidrug efflux pump subunit AcrA (membrane-fusion protein)